MRKFKEILPDICYLVYVMLVATVMMCFVATKDKIIEATGVTPTFKQVVISFMQDFNQSKAVDLNAIQPEMINMPGAYSFDWNDVHAFNNTEKEKVPDKFEWSVSEEYDYIKLKKGWTLSQKFTPTMKVISRDPYEYGGSGIGTDGVKARYNQTCFMKDVPYGTKIWLKGLNTAIVFIVTDDNCNEGELVLHQHDKIGELDGEYEVVKCSPPTTNYLPDTPSTIDYENMYNEWKEEAQNERDRYNTWLNSRQNLVES